MRARPRQVEESRGESDRGRLACLHPFPRGHGAHRASTSRSSRTVTCQSRLRFRFLLACHYSFAGTTDSLPNSHCYRPRVYTRRRKDRFVLRYTVCHPSRRPFTCLSALLLTCLLAPHPYPTPPPLTPRVPSRPHRRTSSSIHPRSSISRSPISTDLSTSSRRSPNLPFAYRCIDTSFPTRLTLKHSRSISLPAAFAGSQYPRTLLLYIILYIIYCIILDHIL